MISQQPVSAWQYVYLCTPKKSMFRFLISKRFLLNLAIALLLMLLVTCGSLKFLDIYTQHGETVTVPNFIGYETKKLDQFIEGKEIEYLIIDSVFDLDEPRGTVLLQNPSPEVQVKKGRKIYLTVNAETRATIKLPNIMDVSSRQAIALLETYAIKVANLRYTPDICTNCVLGVEQKGKKIKAGDIIEKGSAVNLILGRGTNSEPVPIPYLNNLTLAEAEELLLSKSLNTGAILCDDCITEEDSLKARVYKQSPGYSSNGMINMGKSIDIYLSVANNDSTSTEKTE